MTMTKFRFLMLATLSTLTAACANDTTTVYQTAPGGNQAQTTNGSLNIPSGIWLDSVNFVTFYQSDDGLVARTEDSSGKTVSVGGFNGGGTGNKAYIGVNDFGGSLVSDIKVIEIEARQDRGTPLAFINIQVDCNGDGAWDATNDGIIVIDSDSTSDVSLTFDFAATFRRLSFSADQPLFKSVNGACGMPKHLESTRAPLSRLPATARLFNGATTDGGMPRNTVMPAIMLVLNDSNQRASKQVTIREMKVNDRSYRFVKN